jgi:hypothetical protein
MRRAYSCVSSPDRSLPSSHFAQLTGLFYLLSLCLRSFVTSFDLFNAISGCEREGTGRRDVTPIYYK